MLFYLHYVMMTSGLSGTSVLLAVFFKTYTGASQGEIGALLMSFPFVGLVVKPLVCSLADRHQAHKRLLLISMLVEMLGYAPFVVLPFWPAFYMAHPRASWYLLALACHVGNAGLGVAWSLGDCLAVNYSQKTGVPFGRMRLMGTISWGVYGFVIGQINETPALPKYTPAFIILHGSMLIELAVVYFWSDADFRMVDPPAAARPDHHESVQAASLAPSGLVGPPYERPAPDVSQPAESAPVMPLERLVDSMPSSVGGTLKISQHTARALLEVFASTDAEELKRRLDEEADEIQRRQQAPAGQLKRERRQQQARSSADLAGALPEREGPNENLNRNPQVVLLKMLLLEDGRLVKYAVLFTLFGIFIAPLNFLFLSVEQLCHERGYNFSQLAGAILISQALMETLSFLVTPYCARHVSRWSLLSLGLVIMAAKYFFYSGWYYDAGLSPYWAVLAEWSHGIPYGIYCTIQADVSLMFANQCRLFIPEMRRLGYLPELGLRASEQKAGAGPSEADVAAQERSITMALRATVQALFSGFQDGLGMGAGALLCGYISDLYSYERLWQVYAAITCLTFAFHLAAELTKGRLSDSYEPPEGTKAHQIMALSRATFEAQRKARPSKGLP